MGAGAWSVREPWSAPLSPAVRRHNRPRKSLHETSIVPANRATLLSRLAAAVGAGLLMASFVDVDGELLFTGAAPIVHVSRAGHCERHAGGLWSRAVILLWGLSGDGPFESVCAALQRRGARVAVVDQRMVLRTSAELEFASSLYGNHQG